MAAPATTLALSLGIAAQRLRHGRALDETSRRETAELLLRAAMALQGHQPPVTLASDPAGLVGCAIEVARDAGMSAPDIVAAVNDALERSARPRSLEFGS